MSNIEQTSNKKQRVIVKRVDLTPKEAKYVAAYCSIGADTCSNQGKSALAAGYSPKNAPTQATRLMKEPRVRAAIRDFHRELMDEAMINPANILAKLENTLNLALEKGDLASANRAIEMQGKYLTMFGDRFDLGAYDEEQRIFDEHEKALLEDSLRLSRVMQLSHMSNQDVIDLIENSRAPRLASPQNAAQDV